MAEDIFAKQIGNKEGMKSLEAKPVVVQGKIAEPVMGKKDGKNAGKEVGKKLVLICKHPDREEPLKLSTMMYIVGTTVKSSTIWIKLDEDGNIEKGSLISILLDKYQVKTLNELDGKALQTQMDANKFLAVKAY
jgi:hypothetical protein